jgi:hypothetical protein
MSTTPDTPTIRRGDKGPAVLRLQGLLRDLGYLKAKPDGEFGPKTLRAVETFQHDAIMEEDGIVGPATWEALKSVIASRPLQRVAPTAKAVPPAAKPATGPSFADWLVNIAKRDVGKVETPRNNQGAWIKRFWPSTSYQDGYSNREPYCAAAMAYWLDTTGDELAKAGLLESLTGMTAEQFEKWRCKSAGAWAWQGWAKKAKGVTVLPDSATPQKGDVCIFDFSHIGLVTGLPAKGRIATIEANTGPAGERDGDGCWEKNRPQEVARCFLRFNFA